MVVQLPNPPLIVAIAGSVVARIADGTTADCAEVAGRLGLAVFAYLELTDGANWLRRLLGAVVMAMLAVTVVRALR